jgi:hypothetical protein
MKKHGLGLLLYIVYGGTTCSTYLAWEMTSAPALASNSSDCNSVTAVKDIKDSLVYCTWYI